MGQMYGRSGREFRKVCVAESKLKRAVGSIKLGAATSVARCECGQWATW